MPSSFHNTISSYISWCSGGLCWMAMIFQSTPEPLPMSIMVAWLFLKQYRLRARWSRIQQRFPPSAFTHQDFPRLPESLRYDIMRLWTVDVERPKSCTEKHCLWTDWQFSHEVRHKVVSHNPSLLTNTKPLADAPFILNLDNLTYTVKLRIVEPSRTLLLVSFSVLFCLCPNFLWMLQASNSVVFYKLGL